MNKAYQLPDIPPAPTSDLQLLVRRLLEWADFSTLPAIFDKLKEEGRDEDLAYLKCYVSYLALPDKQSPTWSTPFYRFVHSCLPLFTFDLYSMEGLMEVCENRSKPLPKGHFVIKGRL